MYACFKSSFTVSATDSVRAGVGDVGRSDDTFFVGACFTFSTCEPEGVIGSLTGPGLNSTLVV